MPAELSDSFQLGVRDWILGVFSVVFDQVSAAPPAHRKNNGSFLS